MKKIWIIFFLFMLSIRSIAQLNLVPNGSFEDTIACPSSSNHVDDCIGWYQVLNSPDYYNVCAAYPVSIPTNFFGEQMPFDGGAYMGLITFASFFPEYREIFGTQLINSLKPGFNYHISMRVSRGNWTNDANCILGTNKLGIRFSTINYSINTPPLINNYAQIFEDSLILDTLNWKLLEWEYIPDSSYSHLFIGNFFDDLSTDTLNIGTNGQPYGRGGYYIDSVNVVCTNCPTGVKDEINLSKFIFYNPITNTLTNSEKIYSKISIINSLGKMVYSQIIDGFLTLNLNQFSNGLYLIVIGDKKSISTTKIIIHY